MTKPRKWPTKAKWARDDAAQCANDAYRTLSQLLIDWPNLTETERIRRIAIAARHCHAAAIALHAIGAPIILP